MIQYSDWYYVYWIWHRGWCGLVGYGSHRYVVVADLASSQVTVPYWKKIIDAMKIYIDKNREDILFVQGYSSSWYPQRKRHLREYRPICFFTDTLGHIFFTKQMKIMHFRFLRYFKYFFFYFIHLTVTTLLLVSLMLFKSTGKKKSEFTNIRKIVKLNKILELKLLVCFRNSKVS